MKVRIPYHALMASLALGLASCSENPIATQQEKPATNVECPPDVICTKIFSTVAATLTYQDNSPVALDRYQIIQTASGTDRTPQLSAEELDGCRQAGTYPIISDAHQQELANQQLEVEFIGYKDKKELVRRKLTVGADCCHVKHIAGELAIRIDK